MKTYNFIPICFIDIDYLLVMKSFKIYTFNMTNKNLTYICDVPISLKYKLLGKIKLTARLFRLVNPIGYKINERIYLIAMKGYTYKLDLQKKEIIFLFSFDKGNKPLSFCTVSDSTVVKEGIYYGDYWGNHPKNPTSIYRIDTITLKKETVYTFPKGEVNHIHNILNDTNNKCVWIFTGDFGNAAAIWKVTNNFKEVKPVLRGKQIYRSCIAYTHNGTVYYATDTPFQKNSFRKLILDKENNWLSVHIANLNGSVIYGTRNENKLIFSSAVEPNGNDVSTIRYMLSRKRGNGIASQYVYIYAYNLENQELEIIYKQEKDNLPYPLFQFGILRFPSNLIGSNKVPVYHVATKKNDLKTTLIDLR